MNITRFHGLKGGFQLLRPPKSASLGRLPAHGVLLGR